MIPDEVQKLFQLHEQATARLREEMAARKAGEVLYDDYLLHQLRKGKPFKIALRKANAKFPTEALADSGEQMAQAEQHYLFMLRTEELDAYRAKIVQTDQEIAAIDAEIARLRAAGAGPTPPPDAGSGTGTSTGQE